MYTNVCFLLNKRNEQYSVERDLNAAATKKIDKVNIHRLSQAKNYFSFSKCFASQSASLPQDSAAGFHTNRILFIYNIGLIHVFSVVNIRRGPKNVVFFFNTEWTFFDCFAHISIEYN